MTETMRSPIYEMTLSLCISWQAHNMSTVGSEGNRLLPRRQFLADGTVTDACSGNIFKRQHAALATEQFGAEGCPICPACQRGDGRRAAALVDRPEYAALTYEQIVRDCAVCDTHGFLVTAKNADAKQGTDAREKLTKDTLIEFSYTLARPDRQNTTIQLHTRAGLSNPKDDGQMLMKMPVRSGEYALTIRYTCVGIGADTNQWRLIVTDPETRLKRHIALLRALRDWVVSPTGAKTATMLPHLTGLVGVIAVRNTVGRAPCLSALDKDFIVSMQAIAALDSSCQVYTFDRVEQFYAHMNHLLATSTPALHPSWIQETRK